MAFGVQSDNYRRALIGRPSLRRTLKGLDSGRLQQFMLSQDSDNRLAPGRNKPFLRRRLEEFAQAERAAAPVRERAEIEQARNEAAASGNNRLRELADKRLRQMGGGWGTVAAQNNPDRWGSAASIRFSGMFGEG